MSSSFVLASLFFMLGIVVGGSANEWRRRHRGRGRRAGATVFARYYPDDYANTSKAQAEATDANASKT